MNYRFQPCYIQISFHRFVKPKRCSGTRAGDQRESTSPLTGRHASVWSRGELDVAEYCVDNDVLVDVALHLRALFNCLDSVDLQPCEAGMTRI